MATFSEENFGYDAYATYRPTYPSTLYTDHLLPYHHGPRTLLLDIGCGPGTVTRQLSRYFTHAIGTDPSAGMLIAANSATPTSEYLNVTYQAASAESLPFLKDGEVDMVTAAQCAHWFSYPEFWAEMARVVRPGGTVACWGYKDPAFVGKHNASAVIARYSYRPDSFGPYWSQPGRGRIQGRYRCLVPLDQDWEAVERWEYETSLPNVEIEDLRKFGYVQEIKKDADMTGKLVRQGEVFLKMSVTLGNLESYMRTWSTVHSWKEAHPQRVARKDGGSGDLMDELFDELRQVVPEWNIEGWRGLVVDMEMGHGVVCTRRKG